MPFKRSSLKTAPTACFFKNTAKLMKKTHFIGIDVSKMTLDAAIFAKGKDVREFEHVKVSNDKDGFKKLLSWLKERHIGKSAYFGMEFTGFYCLEFQDFLERHKITYTMLKPAILKGYPFVPVDKDDTLDSQKLADVMARFTDRLQPYDLPSGKLLELQEMRRVRKELVNTRTRLELELQNTVSKNLGTMLRKQIDGLNEDVHAIEKDMEDLVQSDNALMENYVLLRTVPSIGIVNAMNTLVLTRNFTMFENGRQYARRTGVAPKTHDSGRSVHWRKRPSPHADLSAKADLSRAAENAIVNNTELKAYYERKMHGKTRKEDPDTHRKTINAVMFKLILRMFAVVRRHEPYKKEL